MTARLRDAAGLVGWLATLVVAIAAFTAMGAGQLVGPTLTAPGSWADWAMGRDPVIAAASVLRLVVLVLAWYLLGATVLGAMARVARLAPMVRMADALTLPVVRRVLEASLGVGLATAVAVSSTATAGPTSGRGVVLAVAASEAADAPTMRPLPPRETPVPASPTGPTSPSAEASPVPRPAHADGATDTVTVRPGDHLWSLAEDHLSARAGSAATDDDVAAYWRRVIAANHDRLVDPANPDLILPGQQLVLPDLHEVQP